MKFIKTYRPSQVKGEPRNMYLSIICRRQEITYVNQCIQYFRTHGASMEKSMKTKLFRMNDKRHDRSGVGSELLMRCSDIAWKLKLSVYCTYSY